jgi:hypothetical protein
MVERAVDNRKTGVQFSVPLPKENKLNKILIAALVASMVATTANATDFTLRGSYQDTGAYTASVTASGPRVGSFDSDLTVRTEGAGQLGDVNDLELGVTYGDRFTVRGALGFAFADGDAESYYSVQPAYRLDVPFTDRFLVRANYENAFYADNFETYGVGAEAGWNVGPVGVTLGVDSFYGDREYTQYTVGVTRKF